MPRRKEKVYHYIYKTTCNVNEKFYIGIHSTDNLDDGYLGSGKRLGYSIKKYGKDSHKKEILEFLPDRGSLKDKERELVNEELLQNPMCMNLQEGGSGGFIDNDHMMKCSLAGASKGGKVSGKIHADKILSDPQFKKMNSEKLVKFQDGSVWIGRNHQDESKNKISKLLKGNRSGNNNPMYGRNQSEETKEKIRKTLLKRNL
jgi:hypothetical protein